MKKRLTQHVTKQWHGEYFCDLQLVIVSTHSRPQGLELHGTVGCTLWCAAQNKSDLVLFFCDWVMFFIGLPQHHTRSRMSHLLILFAHLIRAQRFCVLMLGSHSKKRVLLSISVAIWMVWGFAERTDISAFWRRSQCAAGFIFNEFVDSHHSRHAWRPLWDNLCSAHNITYCAYIKVIPPVPFPPANLKFRLGFPMAKYILSNNYSLILHQFAKERQDLEYQIWLAHCRKKQVLNTSIVPWRHLLFACSNHANIPLLVTQ